MTSTGPPGDGEAAPRFAHTGTATRPPKPSASVADLDRAAADVFLRMAFGSANYGGFVALAFGRNGYWTDKGRYEHNDRAEVRYRWPAERDQLLGDVARELLDGRVDVYVCPALRGMDDRKQADPHAVGAAVWVDLDGGEIPDQLVDAGAAVVDSGTPGHAHLYLPLAAPVDAVRLEGWNKGLRDLVGGDHKWSNNSLLRLPGTVNYKADPPTLVEWRTRPTRVLSPADVDKLLRPAGRLNSTVPAAGRPELDRYPRVRGALAEVYDDRSAGFHRVVAEMFRASWTRAQMAAELRVWPQTPDRFTHRLGDEIDRCLVKVVDEAQARRSAAHPADLIASTEPKALLPDGRRVRLTPASTIKPLPVRWLWTDRIPVGEVTLTPGRGGIGKSTFHAWVIAGITRATLAGTDRGRARACIIAAAEDSWQRTIVPRLIAADADLDRVYRVDVVTEGDAELSLTLPQDCDALAVEITRIGAALLSVDPLMSTIAGSLDTHKDREVRHALEPLARLADRTGCAVLGNAHFNKSSGSDPLSLVTGSAAFGNVARAALGFARDTEAEDGSCVVSQIKNNLGRLDLPSLRYAIKEAVVDTEEGPAAVGRLVMLGESERSVGDILRDRDDEDDRGERDEAVEWIRDYLTEHKGEANAGDLLKDGVAAGHAKRTLQRARKRARVETRKAGTGWVWALVPEAGDLVDDHQGANQGAKMPGDRHQAPWRLGGALQDDPDWLDQLVEDMGADA